MLPTLLNHSKQHINFTFAFVLVRTISNAASSHLQTHRLSSHRRTNPRSFIPRITCHITNVCAASILYVFQSNAAPSISPINMFPLLHHVYKHLYHTYQTCFCSCYLDSRITITSCTNFHIALNSI